MDNNKSVPIVYRLKSLLKKIPSLAIERFKYLLEEAPLPETENEENELPTEIASSLKKAIKNLPCHPKYITIIQSTLNEALSEWQENPEANELVILSNYVEPLSKIIQIALADSSYENVEQTKLLSWSNRPTDCLKVVPQLQKELELSAKLNIDNNPVKSQELVVIPCLEFCFLRHIQGLDGIEFLRNRIFQDRSRFWLIGCNTLTWQYLDQIYKINSYFEKTLSLPNIEGAELREWLAPVIDKLEFFSGEETTEKQTEKIQEYFDDLSNIAQGSSFVAAQLWLKSLTIANIENLNTEPETEQPILVKYNKPKLLDLPELTPEDRYLLFSMLLHKEINLSHLALSLGESESVIQFQIQKLLDQGVIQRFNGFLIVNPSHYPKLLKHLTKYNFITDLIE